MDSIQQLVQDFDETLPHVVRQIQQYISEVPEAKQITLPQAYLMRYLYMNGPCNASAIGHLLGVTSGPVTSITNRLIRRGYLKRKQNAKDRRVMEFSLSSEGERILSSMLGNRKKKWEQLFEQLGESKSRLLVELFQEIQSILQDKKM